MTLPQNISDREYNKFFEDASGNVRVRTITEGQVTAQGLQNGGIVTEVTINETTWTALPSTPLADRNALRIQNRSGQEIKLNYSDSVSGYVGVYVENGSDQFYDISDSIIIYAKSSTSSCSVVVEELS